MLPDIPYKNGATKVPVAQFGGLERRIGAGNGTIVDMLNLTGRHAPVLSSRDKRYTMASLTQPRGIWGNSYHLLWVDNGTLYKDGAAFVSSLPSGANPERIFAAMGNRLLIWPDKVLVDIEGAGSYQQLGVSTTKSCTFVVGTNLDTSLGNTIYGPSGTDWSTIFKVGDGVTITGAEDAANNKTAIVREIDGRNLRFDENAFTLNSTARNITLARTIPDLDYICVNDNRVWGCKGDEIRCSKLGDPTNWNSFENISTSSFSVETGTAGIFTGCISFMGYPCFFKEDRVFKVYGNRPTNYEVMGSATLGVLPGAAKTLAVAGETLYYLSRAGFVRYNGGYPSVVDAALDRKYTAGAAGSDGRKYYVSAETDSGESEFLTLDPETGMWFKEDDTVFLGFGFYDAHLYGMTGNGVKTVTGIPEGATTGIEADFESGVQFAEFDLQTFASKYPVRLWARYEAESTLDVYIRYNGGTWEKFYELPATGKAAKYLPVPIRRCDRFQVGFNTTGAWKLYAMEIETRAQTTSRRGG